MNLRSWMMLVFLLSAGTSLAQVDVNWLTGIVEAITDIVRNQYGITGQYCLAVNIPLNQDKNTLSSILPGKEDVRNTVQGQTRLYIGNSIVIARENQQVHAERQVLANLQTLTSDSEGKFLLIYSFLSPCGTKCANLDNYNDNILDLIRTTVPTHWTDFAFVFTKVFNGVKYGMEISKEQLKETLQNLGESGLGLVNIYRCFGTKPLGFQCYSCSSQLEVSDVCVDNNWGQGGSSDLINRKWPGYRSPSESSSSGGGGRYRGQGGSSYKGQGGSSRVQGGSSYKGQGGSSKKKPRQRSQSESSSSSSSSSSSGGSRRKGRG